MLALRRSKNAYVDAPYSLVAGLKTESRQNFTNTGRNGPRVKTKTVLKPVNKKEQLGGMPKMKNLNKNPPNVTVEGVTCVTEDHAVRVGVILH